MKVQRNIINLIVGIATIIPFVVFSSAFAREVPKSSIISLGGINLDDYCKKTFDRNSRAVIVEENAYGWKCLIHHAAGRVSYEPMNLDIACQTQYKGHNNGQNVLSGYLDWNDPYSWICWKPERP